MDAEMHKTLDKFFAEKTIQDVDRNTFQICNLRDKLNLITISLVFLKDWDSLETDDYNCVVVEKRGAVFTFPCYWLSVPKELCMPYMEYIIDDFYSQYVSKWVNGNNPGGGGGTTPGGNCPCMD